MWRQTLVDRTCGDCQVCDQNVKNNLDFAEQNCEDQNPIKEILLAHKEAGLCVTQKQTPQNSR